MQSKLKAVIHLNHMITTFAFTVSYCSASQKVIFCVLGDNFFQSVKFKLIFLPLNEQCSEVISSLKVLGPELTDKKRDMGTFQKEYMDVKKKYEENKKRLKDEDELIQKKLAEHEGLYDQLFETVIVSLKSLH